MPPKTIALLVSGVLVLAAIGYLYVDVRAAPDAVPAKVLDEAREKAKVAERSRATAPSPANLDDPWSRTKVEPVADVKVGSGTITLPQEDQVEPEPTQAPEYRPATPGEASTPTLDGDPRLETSNAKDEANRQYDKQDFEGALATAVKILDREPGDVRMLRVAVSSACQLGDGEKAKQYYAQLPPHDQSQMARRCSRMNITFE